MVSSTNGGDGAFATALDGDGDLTGDGDSTRDGHLFDLTIPSTVIDGVGDLLHSIPPTLFDGAGDFFDSTIPTVFNGVGALIDLTLQSSFSLADTNVPSSDLANVSAAMDSFDLAVMNVSSATDSGVDANPGSSVNAETSSFCSI